jgi:putative FmdB family regulatory protein
VPVREYRCESCGCEWEQLEHMGDRPERFCIRCKKETAVRVISRANFKVNGYNAANGYSRGKK